MTYRKYYGFVVLVLLGSAILGLSASGFSDPPTKTTQRNGGRGGGGGGRSGGGGGNRGGGGARQSSPQAAPVHARREVVRTPNFVQRTNSGSFPRSTRTFSGSAPHIISGPTGQTPLRRPGVSTNTRVVTQRKFTKTSQGRVYDNGLTLRKGIKVTASWERRYFPRGHFHFPYYRPTYVRGACFISPFGFYFGVCVPFISSAYCQVFPPTVAYVDMPVYNGSTCTGFADAGDQNFLNDPNLDQDEPGLGNAVDELTETFQGGNIDGLVTLIDPSTSIAVYLRGTYKYSLAANNYVDLTRDALQSMQSVQFSLRYLHERSPTVFSAAGQQTYRDQSGQIQTVWLSFVLQDIGGQWTLTQVGTAPGVIEKLIP